VKVAIPVLIALTALVVGSALVRGRACGEGPTQRPSVAGSSPAPAKPLPICTSSIGTQAVRMIGAYREQRCLREPAPAAGFSEEQVRRLRSLDRSLDGDGTSLAESLRGKVEAWKELIAVLSAIEEFDSARDVLYRVRTALDPSSEALWIDRLRVAVRADERRLALVALAGRSSRDVVLALARTAREDADRRVRTEALVALAELPRRLLTEDLARTLKETLNASALADQDPAVSERARALATSMNDAGRAPAAPTRRSTFGNGLKVPSDQNSGQ
jgi:hypothetical protein